MSASFMKVVPRSGYAVAAAFFLAARTAASSCFFFAAAARWLNLSTRPAVSISFCCPVNSGWQAAQISTPISGSVEPVVKVLPQAQWTRASGYHLGWIFSFTAPVLYQGSQARNGAAAREGGPHRRSKAGCVNTNVPWTALTVAGLMAGALAAGGAFAVPSAAATPPPTPPPLSAPASAPPSDSTTPAAVSTPIALPSGFGLPGMSAPQPASSTSPTPPADARKGLEGVWELEIQRGSKTDYAHFLLAQSGTTLTGTYLNDAGKKFPLAGSVDGQQVRLVVSMPDGTSLLMEGRLDGTTDMIGILSSGQEQVGFTAAYRPKEKFMDNLNAAPGGLGGAGGGAPGGGGGGGGYPP